jgi:hypothetical protein
LLTTIAAILFCAAAVSSAVDVNGRRSPVQHKDISARAFTSAARFSPLGPVGIGFIILWDDVKTRSIQGS